MAANGVRHGLTGQVQNKMLEFDRTTNKIKWDFKGKDLVKGEVSIANTQYMYCQYCVYVLRLKAYMYCD